MQESPNQSLLDEREAAALCRQFILNFNNATVYGGRHPSTLKNAGELHARIMAALQALPMLTFMIERDVLYVGQWAADARTNYTRLVQAFKKTGIESITFQRGLTGPQTQECVAILAELASFATADSVTSEFNRCGITAIRINYVSFRTVTADEDVVRKGAADGEGKVPVRADFEEQAVGALGKLFSLRDFLEKPAYIAGSILAAAGSDDADLRLQAVSRLRQFNTQVRTSRTGDYFASVDEMMEAVYKLRSELREGMAIQRQVGAVIRDDDEVLAEADRLTYETIVRLVREEYRRGAMTVKRLGLLVRRMLPSSRDLRKLLPMLKDGLLAEGMSPADYLGLVNELRRELEGENLVEALRDGAESAGMSVDDILKGIREDPSDAARLIILASELRKGPSADQFELSKVMSEYIERVSSRMAVDTTGESAMPDEKALETIIGRLEKHLTDRLRIHGVSDELLSQVESELSSRFHHTVRELKSEWLVRLISSTGDITSAFLMKLVDRAIADGMDIDRLNDPLRAALLEKGYDEERIRAVYEEVAAGYRRKKAAAQLPRGVLASSNLLYFLQREIKQAVRYNTVFSTCIVTVVGEQTDTGPKPLAPEEKAAANNGLFTIMTRMLRDLDLIGSIGSVDRNIPFVILSMTGAAGAETVRNRLLEKCASEQFDLGARRCRLRTAVSCLTYDKALTADVTMFLQQVRDAHRVEEERARHA